MNGLDAALVREARELAREAHADHRRKAGDVPYFVHLDAVARILAAHGYDDELTLSAAYLHDLLEDRPGFADRMRAAMPREVVETVEVLSERKKDASGNELDKATRFAGYLANLRGGTEAARRAAPISCADKIDNARSLVAAEREGLGLLTRLRTKPREHQAQLARLRDLYVERVNPALLASFDEAARALVATVNAFLVGRAAAIAAEGHLGQYDKGGAAYVLHPMRLALRARTDEERMAAFLHDVVEDAGWTLERLLDAGFPRAVVRAVERLTRREEESYEAFIERVGADRLASRVKLLDLEDNSDASRLGVDPDQLSETDRARLAKYREARRRLEADLAKRSLYVVLDDASARRVRALAVHPEVRGDHVTLAHRVDPAALAPAWIPGGAAIGASIELKATAHAKDARVQALACEIAGTSVRPSDGGTLHVTVSFTEDARASDANALLTRAALEPLELPLRGRVEWVE